MDRRHFLQAFTGAAGAFAFGTQASALLPTAAAPSVFDAFEAARAGAPWTEAYVGLTSDVAPLTMTLSGRVPRGLAGAFYRNGPARHSLGGERYHHLFDGDGMLQRYDLGAGGIQHRGRFVQTEKFRADSAAGHPVRRAFGTNPPHAEPVTSPDSMNVANTSVVHHGGELLALWEGGSATKVDPETLGTQGFKVWSEDLGGMPFSAHPKVESDGTLWNFGVTSARGLLTVYRIDAAGQLLQTATLPLPQVAMVHDFAVTKRHLVFLLPPLVFEIDRLKGGATFLGSHVWKPQLGLRVLVLPKDRLDAPQWMELPAGFVFHVGNAWEGADGRIRLDCMRADSAWQATTGLMDLMNGRYVPKEFAKVTQIELDLRTGRARQTVMPHEAEFPRIDPRRVGQRHRQLFTALRLEAGDRPGYDAVMRLDMDSGRAEHYRYGRDVIVEEHLFVPRRPDAAEGDGWLIGSAIDVRRRETLFSVFDARHLAAGPVAQGRMPRVMPFGLHGTFVPAG